MSNEISKALRTTARLSLGRTESFVATKEQMEFRLDHALARDAVQAVLDVSALAARLKERGLEVLKLKSAAADRNSYLRRPDLGRKLSTDSVAELEGTHRTCEMAVILADGLSALAIERHALPLLDALLPQLQYPPRFIPVVTYARVAIGDEIGQRLRAKVTVLLIGERPGLSSPDSLGVYITWNPRSGRTDAERNCISNIRLDGLSCLEASLQILHHLEKARRLHRTGIDRNALL